MVGVALSGVFAGRVGVSTVAYAALTHVNNEPQQAATSGRVRIANPLVRAERYRSGYGENGFEPRHSPHADLRVYRPQVSTSTTRQQVPGTMGVWRRTCNRIDPVNESTRMEGVTGLPQHACRPGWEWHPQTDDGHAHDWHMVITQPWGPSHPEHREAMTVCRVCTAPRCGHTFNDDPCTERRHHDSVHIYESGRFEPLGGILRE